MKAVVSTVSSARVTVAGEVVGEVSGPALMALVGVGHDDNADSVATMARKIADLRLFPTSGGNWDAPREASASEVGAQVLVVSQFTLLGATAKGRRPSWSAAAGGDVAEPLIDALVEDLRSRGLVVKTGQFGAMMTVESANEGPFTVLVET